MNWSRGNFTLAVEELMQKASGNAALRKRLLDPDSAKEELARLIKTPRDWRKHVFVFSEDANNDRIYVGQFPKSGSGSLQPLCSIRR